MIQSIPKELSKGGVVNHSPDLLFAEHGGSLAA